MDGRFARLGGASQRARWLRRAVAAVAMPVAFSACGGEPARPSEALLEAVDWYTGVAGTVDDERAGELLGVAVRDGNPLAVMWLARVHSRGRMGFERDGERARSLARGVVGEVRRAADAGVLEAVFLMGTAYDEGLGQPVDAEAASRWHRRAAEEGHVLAAHVLGNAYAAGRGVPRDPQEAVKWWTLAAEAGDAIPQLRLGEAYESGVGADRNLEQAAEWYRRAAAAGNEVAQAALERLEAESPNR